jgi:hypothetical protein
VIANCELELELRLFTDNLKQLQDAVLVLVFWRKYRGRTRKVVLTEILSRFSSRLSPTRWHWQAMTGVFSTIRFSFVRSVKGYGNMNPVVIPGYRVVFNAPLVLVTVASLAKGQSTVYYVTMPHCPSVAFSVRACTHPCLWHSVHTTFYPEECTCGGIARINAFIRRLSPSPSPTSLPSSCHLE